VAVKVIWRIDGFLVRMLLQARNHHSWTCKEELVATDCIGIDIGYGYTKTCRAGDRHIFPTAVTLMATETTFSEATPIVVNGRRFLVGKEAEREGATVDTCQSGFVTSDAWLACLAECLRINGFPQGEIVLGVPPGMYSRSNTQKILEAVRKSEIGINGDPCRISNGIRIIPQGAGIFFRHIEDRPDDYRKNVAVIDIGHHTVDMVLFSAGKYVESARESREIGVWLVLDGIVKAFYREHGLQIGLRNALDILRTGQMTHLGVTYTLDASEEVNRYTWRFESVVNRYLEKLPIRPDVGVMGGGGAMVLDHLVELRHHLLMVSEPAMANAVGYWLYGNDER
jgi:hypothetical protein